MYQPEIPPNTGNIIRLCANTGAQLHLIQPLGFKMEDRELRRAGLDYHEWASVHIHVDLQAFYAQIAPRRRFGLSTHGRTGYTAIRYQAGDALLFGSEGRGLPAAVLADLGPGRVLRIPMRPAIRSLNLSNAVAVVLYEAWRQQGFDGAE